MLTNSNSCQTSLTSSGPLLGIVSKQKIVYKWGEKRKKKGAETAYQEEQNTAHTQHLNNVTSRAINEETKKFVLTSNQTKDQRGSQTFRNTGGRLSLSRRLYNSEYGL